MMAVNNAVVNFCKETYQDRFKRYLLVVLVVLGSVLVFTGQEAASPIPGEGFEVVFFYAPGCSHCHEQKPFMERLAGTYPSVDFISHDISSPEELSLLLEMMADMDMEGEPSGPPATIFGGQLFVGWDSEETTGKRIELALQQCLAGNCPEMGGKEPLEKTTLPIIGEVTFADYSLLSLAIMLGFVDGFNPCAMWVLAYLISLIMTLNDRRKIWLLVGTFVFASGVLYFLFMTAWLNAFLLIGYSRPMTVLIGLAALGTGTLNIREFIKTKGAIVCKVGSAESKKKTMARMEKVILSPLTLATIAGIVALAFVVNSIEFLCSSALPAIFTGVLSLSDLPTLHYYAYILLYDFFFMLDDMVIFSLAALAVTSNPGSRYARFCRPFGGAILLVMGVLLLFAPQVLR